MLTGSSKTEVVESASSFESVTQAIYLVGLWSFPALMTYAALRDLLSFTIPNWIPVLVICGFFLVVVTKGSLWSLATLLHASTGIAVLAVVALLFFRGLIGGGDAKLIAAASLWMGWPQLTPFLLIMAFSGGVLALVWLVAQSVAKSALASPRTKRYFTNGHGIPYGVAVGFSGVVVFITHDWARSGLLNIFGPDALQ